MLVKGDPPDNAVKKHSPPAYTELASETPPSSTTFPASSTVRVQQPPEQHAHNYGPTPIGVYYPNSIQQPVDGSTVGMAVDYLPYYDPSSSHAIAEAEQRGRRRFFGALLWVVMICLVLGLIGGGAAKS